MGCISCKKKKEGITEKIVKDIGIQPNTKLKKIKDHIIKFLVFLLLVIVLTPLIIPILIFVLFRMVVLSKDLNVLPLVYYLAKKIFKENDEEEDEEDYDDDLNEADYELENPHEIVEIN